MIRVAGCDTDPAVQETRQDRARLTAELLDQARTADDRTRRRLLEQVVTMNMPVAEALAARYRDRGVAEEDLRQVAYLALVRAADRFDPDFGESDFVGYAVPTIRGELRRYFRDHGWVIRPPRRIQELQPRINRASEELAALLNRAPRVSELVAHLGEEEDDIIEALAAFGNFAPISLDAPMTGAGAGDQDITLADVQRDDDTADQDGVEARVTVHPALARLSPREQHILVRRFYDGWTQREIGREIGVSQMQVSRLITQALDRMRDQIGDLAPPPPPGDVEGAGAH